ncbi:DoxX family protein [Candidatus Rhabdochlamydia sp. T3358]|uniref:DoxX family protein n=1 Tax=Candidatus Rhabdochlamydia sp. T3358 TaxID=2099795 RepID=UPI0010B97AD6|nr:DoxX family protein [Candidatus Rhabdochlamydia sp. T3358]VHO04676.1 DoxX [Candidatus Rhabdochlamydia sp. T3358]
MFRSTIIFLGRVCISLIFIATAFQKLLDWQGAEQQFITAIHNLSGISGQKEWIKQGLEMILSRPSLAFFMQTIIQFLGGVCIFLGLFVRFAAFILALVVLGTILVFYPFWLTPGIERASQMTLFLQHLSMLGGLLLLMGYDRRKKEVIIRHDPIIPPKIDDV